MKKIIGNPSGKNQELIKIIKKTKLNNFYIKNKSDFRDYIFKDISSSDDVLDIGKSMRDKFEKINSKSLITLDVNEFDNYPDIVFDICDEIDESLKEKFNKIICLAILELFYDPFKAVKNIHNMLKPDGVVYGYVPYLYQYHAPSDLKFQDYFRFSKDALSFLFKEFNEVELFPVRGRVSAPLNILFGTKWKKYFEKTKINFFLDKFISDEKNSIQCSGYNFIAKK